VKGISWLCVGKMPINAQVRADDWSDLVIGEMAAHLILAFFSA